MNLYANLEEIKDQINKTQTDDDVKILRLLNTVSRLIDKITGRKFYPRVNTLYLHSQGQNYIWLPEEILEITSLELSSDNGATYNTLSSSEYFLSSGVSFEEPYQKIILNPNGDQGYFYPGFRSVKITGIWGYSEDYANAWLDTGDTVQDNPLEDDSNDLTVADVDSIDPLNLYNRFSEGDLLKIGSEFVYTTDVNSQTNVVSINRGVNNSDAAQHTQSTTIYKWDVHPIIKQACIIQTVRTWKRAENAFQDATANRQTGQMLFTKKLDPEVELMLYNSKLVKVNV